VATGHTDAQGRYRIAYLRPGTYVVRFEEPIIPALTPVTHPGVTVARGATTTEAAFLATRTANSAGVHLSGATSIGVGGTGGFSAWVFDSAGNPDSSPIVTWALSDTSVAAIGGDSSYAGGSAAFVVGKAPGWVTVTATSGAFADSVLVQVLGQPAPVASVTLTPSDTTLAAGDSVEFRALLRDSTGTEVAGEVAVSWSISDSMVVQLTWTGGRYALVRPVGAGTAVLQALVQGKVGRSTLTVH
jgi:hypothetical protein